MTLFTREYEDLKLSAKLTIIEKQKGELNEYSDEVEMLRFLHHFEQESIKFSLKDLREFPEVFKNLGIFKMVVEDIFGSEPARQILQHGMIQESHKMALIIEADTELQKLLPNYLSRTTIDDLELLREIWEDYKMYDRKVDEAVSSFLSDKQVISKHLEDSKDL